MSIKYAITMMLALVSSAGLASCGYFAESIDPADFINPKVIFIKNQENEMMQWTDISKMNDELLSVENTIKSWNDDIAQTEKSILAINSEIQKLSSEQKQQEVDAKLDELKKQEFYQNYYKDCKNQDEYYKSEIKYKIKTGQKIMRGNQVTTKGYITNDIVYSKSKSEIYNSDGDTFVYYKKYEEALKKYNAALGENDAWLKNNLSKVYSDRGYVFFNLNMLDEAIKDYTMSLEQQDYWIKGNKSRVYEKISQVYVQKKDYPEAIKQYKKSTYIWNSDYWCNLGDLEFIQKHYDKALNYYHRSLEQKDSWIEKNRSRVYKSIGITSAALNDLSDARYFLVEARDSLGDDNDKECDLYLMPKDSSNESIVDLLKNIPNAKYVVVGDELYAPKNGTLEKLENCCDLYLMSEKVADEEIIQYLESPNIEYVVVGDELCALENGILKKFKGGSWLNDITVKIDDGCGRIRLKDKQRELIVSKTGHIHWVNYITAKLDVNNNTRVRLTYEQKELITSKTNYDPVNPDREEIKLLLDKVNDCIPSYPEWVVKYA